MRNANNLLALLTLVLLPLASGLAYAEQDEKSTDSTKPVEKNDERNDEKRSAPKDDDVPAIPSADEEAVPEIGDLEASKDPAGDLDIEGDEANTENDDELGEDDDEPEDDLRDWLDSLPFDVSVRLEGRAGSRVTPDAPIDRMTLGEGRLQLHLAKHFEAAELKLVTTTDFLLDSQGDTSGVDLQRGTGLVDLRQAHIAMQPVPYIALRVGRQIITWGTGDLIFINDLFPKDWQSFLLGRDLEYLKAPSDAARLDLNAGRFALSAVFTPQFDPDRFITGERLVYSNGQALSTSGEPFPVDIPDELFSDFEASGRLRVALGSYELALYGYKGYWKSPLGFDPMTGAATFPKLSVGGGSFRGPVLGSIIWLEGGYYLSDDDGPDRTMPPDQDEPGADPFTPNSEIRGLVGVERSFGPVVTTSAQAYIERMQNYDAYIDSLPRPIQDAGAARDQNRVLVTFRLNLDWARQQLRASVFTYYSPTDEDVYVRPSIQWGLGRFTRLDVGANLFFGASDNTFFGQHEKNSNVYGALRFSL